MPNSNESINVSPSTNAAEDLEEQRGSNTMMSMLTVSDDPFAPREGKTLLWKNVNMTLVSRASHSKT
jgi:hypothetical protein